MKSVTSLLAGAALVAAAGGAMAGEPVALSEASMDQVTAGISLADAAGLSVTYGDVLSETATYVETYTDDFSAAALAESEGLAASFVFGAASQSAIEVSAFID
jgi:hypothetical protein